MFFCLIDVLVDIIRMGKHGNKKPLMIKEEKLPFFSFFIF